MSNQTTVAVEDGGRYTNILVNGTMIASYDEQTERVCHYEPDSDRPCNVVTVDE